MHNLSFHAEKGCPPRVTCSGLGSSSLDWDMAQAIFTLLNWMAEINADMIKRVCSSESAAVPNVLNADGHPTGQAAPCMTAGSLLS